jgi:hypothetical protein
MPCCVRDIIPQTNQRRSKLECLFVDLSDLMRHHRQIIARSKNIAGAHFEINKRAGERILHFNDLPTRELARG